MPSQPLPPYANPQQYQQPQPPRRLPISLLVVVTVIVLAASGGIYAATHNSYQAAPAATASPIATTLTAEQIIATSQAIDDANAVQTPVPTSPPETPTPANPHGDVGVTQQSGYWTVTVNSIKTSQGDLVAPKAGDTYISINVTAKNTDSSTHLISVIDFSLRGTDGTSYSYGATDAQEPSGNVLSGQPIRGDVVFEVPASVHDFTMQFDGDFNPDDTVQWSLSDN